MSEETQSTIFSRNHSPADLEGLRAKAVGLHAEMNHAPSQFTCDKCPSAPKCVFAFDPYNTDGDCLADK